MTGWMKDEGGEEFRQTMDLRFVERDVAITHEVYGDAFIKRRILQQAWQGNKGTVRWQDIPLQEDDD